jgi:integrase
MAAPKRKRGEKRMLEELDVSFKEQSEKWLKWATTRNRKPILLTSVPTIRGALDNYILPEIGSLRLSKVHNGSCKPIVDKMKAERLAPSSMNGYMNVVKAIMKSVIDPESGEPVFNRRWNSTFLDLPVVEHSKTPCLTAAQVESMLADAKYAWERRLYLVLASTGLRISEVLALEWRHLVNDGRTLIVEQKVDRFGKIVRRMKTKSGKREIDLHSSVAKELLAAKELLSAKSSDLMFSTRNGTPHLSNNIERRLLRNHVTGSWHQFRRFRNTHLRKSGCLEDLRLFWMGHKPTEMGEVYSKLKDDLETRLEWAEKLGVGFKIVPMDEFRSRKVGKPRGWTLGKSKRRVYADGTLKALRLRDN